MDNFMNWETLGTFAGAVAATVAIVQLIKGTVDSKIHMPTRFLAYIIALLIGLAAKQFTVGLDWNQTLLCIVNAIGVALAAMSAHDLVVVRPEMRSLVEKEIELEEQEAVDADELQHAVNNAPQEVKGGPGTPAV